MTKQASKSTDTFQKGRNPTKRQRYPELGDQNVPSSFPEHCDENLEAINNDQNPKQEQVGQPNNKSSNTDKKNLKEKNWPYTNNQNPKKPQVDRKLTAEEFISLNSLWEMFGDHDSEFLRDIFVGQDCDL